VDLGPLVAIGFAWLVVNAIRKAVGRPSGNPRPPGTGQRTPPATTSRMPSGPTTRVPALPRPLPPATGMDATQREGQRLENLLRELGRTLDQASGPAGRAPDRRLPPAQEVEERESLEVAPEAQSLEVDPRRGERAVVDQDDEAERVIARRLAAAEANAAPRTWADRVALDSRIRQEPADKTATRAYTVQQLREAVVWREILGPPVSMRGEEER
jgi:hypothetical protein